MGAAAIALGFVMWIIVLSEMVFVFALQTVKASLQGQGPRLAGMLKAGDSVQPSAPDATQYGARPLLRAYQLA